MTVLGAAEPMPMGRQPRDPAVAVSAVFLVIRFEGGRKVGRKALVDRVSNRRRRVQAVGSFMVIVIGIDMYCEDIVLLEQTCSGL